MDSQFTRFTAAMEAPAWFIIFKEKGGGTVLRSSQAAMLPLLIQCLFLAHPLRYVPPACQILSAP